MSPESSPTKRTKRNVLANNTQATNLPLSPPVTPTKKRVLDFNTTAGSKKLSFGTKNVYSQAKALFQRGHSQVSALQPAESLIERDREASQLNQFLINTISSNVCNSVYISGPPGTGKSAQCDVSFNYITNKIATSVNDEHIINGNRFRIIKINCMTISKPEYIFHEIYCSITKTSSLTLTRKKTFDDVYDLFLHSSPELPDSIVLLLDEMDCLITKDQQVLFLLFNCASQFKSKLLATKLILIGISNALDLTDKFLPRLKSNGLNPVSLQFLPYTSDKIKSIIISKLRSLTNDTNGSIPIMNPIAIQLCCKKSASVTGDLRKAFDICYKSIELIEATTKKNGDLGTLTFENAPKVHISHVASIFSNAFGIDTLTKLKNLNLLQKLVLCILFKFHSDSFTSNKKKLTVNCFYDYYTRFIGEKIDNLLGKLNKGEFLEIISALESSSVVTLNGSDYGIDIGNQIIKANIPYDDLLKSVGEIGVLKNILNQ